MSTRRLAALLALASAAVLLAMVAVAMTTGATQEVHEHYHPPAEYAAGLLAHAGGLRLLVALDVGFLVLYTATFAALTRYLRALGQPFTALALGMLIGTAVLDILEDHQILAALRLAEADRPISDTWIAAQQILSATKFSVSYLGLFCLGLAIPRTTRLGWVLAAFLTVGTLASGVLGFALAPSAAAGFDAGRWVGFLAGFALAAAWLRTAPEPG